MSEWEKKFTFVMKKLPRMNSASRVHSHLFGNSFIWSIVSLSINANLIRDYLGIIEIYSVPKAGEIEKDEIIIIIAEHVLFYAWIQIFGVLIASPLC